jgi:hypothetical protein
MESGVPKTLKQIWHDPVWSKVILALLTAVWVSVHFNWWAHLPAVNPLPPCFSLLVLVLVLVASGIIWWLTLQVEEARRQLSQLKIEPNITTVDLSIPPENKSEVRTYPLKCYVQLRNDSAACADVRIYEFRPNTVTLKTFVVDVLQLKLREWVPKDHGVDQLAVLVSGLDWHSTRQNSTRISSRTCADESEHWFSWLTASG